MNIDIKLLNRITSNLTLQIMKKIIHYDKLGIFQDCEVDLTSENVSM